MIGYTGVMAKPLKNIRILDLSRVLAGPWCTQILADLGAEVIKIEKPGEGDDTRHWGPPFLNPQPFPPSAPAATPTLARGEGDVPDLSAYFISANRGKKSVAVDIAKPEGQKIVQALAAKSDVVIENFKAGGLKKYGLDYESLKKINPKIVYCSITGFGQDGPYAHKAGYDFMIQGLCGLMSVTGEPAGMPMKDGVALVDVMTGMYSAVAIQAALMQRMQCGEGAYIDMALLDVGVAMMANQALNYLVSGVAPKRLGNAHPNIVPYQAFATKDGHVILAIGNDDQFARFCNAAGKPEWIKNPHFATNQARVVNRETVVGAITVLMHQKTTSEWLVILEKENIPGGPINDLKQVFSNPQVKSRGIAGEITGSDGTPIPQVASPIRLAGKGASLPPPRLGEHTEQVLKDVLGFNDATIQELLNKEIL